MNLKEDNKLRVFKPIPTDRAWIDPCRACNVNCKFCYNHYQDMKGFKTELEIKKEILKAKGRDCKTIDFSGGETMLIPFLPEIIDFIHQNDMRVCIITNATAGEKRLEKVLKYKPDEWLVSIHGLENTHDWLVEKTGARKRQIKFIETLVKNNQHLRFNTVINSYNQKELFSIAEEFSKYNPVIHNFINFNPHGLGNEDMKRTVHLVADLRIVEKELNKLIPYYEENNTGVNLRYFPMCRIKEEYRRCVCNNYQVMFDPFEWDYGVYPHTFENHFNWGRNQSDRIDWRGFPCNICDIKNICGGIKTSYNLATAGMMIDKVEHRFRSEEEKYDSYYYRRYNNLTINPGRQYIKEDKNV